MVRPTGKRVKIRSPESLCRNFRNSPYPEGRYKILCCKVGGTVSKRANSMVKVPRPLVALRSSVM